MNTTSSITAVNLTRSIIEVFRDYEPLMRIRCIVIFLEVAALEGQTLSTLQRATGIQQSAFSRAMSELRHINWRKKPGLDLVTITLDEMDARNHRAYLTQAGKFLVKQLSTAITDKKKPLKT